MSLISNNIRFLRKRLGLTQEQMAQKIGIKRSLQGAYEEGRADPRINNLVNYAKVFELSTDLLVTKDLGTLSEEEIKALKSGQKNATAPPNDLRVLTVSVDKEDNEHIELIPQKASAGYLNGYADPEYIKEQQKFQLPFLPKGASYRAFEISGDSMLPLKSGTIIIGKYLEDVHSLKSGKTYIVLTKSEGIVYKRVFNYLKEKNCLYMVSDNRQYAAYNVTIDDIIEIWEAKAFISVSFPEQEEEMPLNKLTNIVLDLQQEVIKLKNK